MNYFILSVAIVFCSLAVKAQDRTLDIFDLKDTCNIIEKPCGEDPKISKDSLDEYFLRSSGFNVYTYTSKGQTMPLTGSNLLYFMLGSKFQFSGDSKILGVLVAFAGKTLRNGIEHAIIAYHLTGTGQLPGGQTLGKGYFNVNDIDTNSTTPTWSYIAFSPGSQPIINSNFAVFVQTRIGYLDDDSITIFSNLIGNGRQEHTACDLYTIDSIFYTENLYNAPISIDGGGKPDFDVMIIPVLDVQSLSSVDNFKLNGLSCKIASPIPVRDRLALQISSEIPVDVNIELLDIKGKVIYEMKSCQVNTNSIIEFDVNRQPAGTYMFVVRSSLGTFAGMFVHE